MEKYRLNIDGKEVQGFAGQTILEVARENDIHIPTLCYDERTKIYGACGLCVCEVEGNPKLVKACATEIAPNMVVKTRTERVVESRKTNLELLLSNHRGDCRPPCVQACPAHTDCQGYVGLLANGEFEKAIELVRDRIPLPASLGRVCPHPCEDACRRALVDEPIAIQNLKRFLADRDMYESEHPFLPEVDEPSGKRVAIVGGGPLGLSAAYFLRQKGHEVTIYEAMPRCGGMLRYGIPEYRLPKAVLDDEIRIIEHMGVNILTDTKIGRDVSFETLRASYDAVLLGIGAWVSTGVGCPGEDAEGVIGGIDFLRRVVRKEEIVLGKNVAIVGGGNTAMDACRTAVRLGAKKVYNIYRRTKDEMPADAVEIQEAEEEGVIFLNLRNPLEIVKDKNGHIKEAVLQVMELGEPDASGRRAPKPVPGKTERIALDNMILAIGQTVDAKIFETDKTRKGAIKYDPETFRTSIPGVFAGGDCGNDKISIAVEAVADAKKASDAIDAYLNGEELRYQEPYIVERDDVTAKTFEDRERQCRPEMPQLSAAERKGNFTEVVFGYDEEDAVREANRCLECGCHDYYECKLIEFAREYKVEPERLAGEKLVTEFADDHPFIVRDPNKCILCGACVRVCEEVTGVGALGLVHRGFDTVVMPALEKPLCETDCISCGQCVSACPVGALQERQSVAKEVPVRTDKVETTCSFCSVGCTLTLESCGEMLIKANAAKDGAVNRGMACGMGKWGFDSALVGDKLFTPLVKEGRVFRNADAYEALLAVCKSVQSVSMRFGKDAVAVSVSDRYTNEEAYAIKKFADLIGAKTFSFDQRHSGLEDVLGLAASPNTIDELQSADVILLAGFAAEDHRVIDFKLKQAADRGAKVLLLQPETCRQKMKYLHKAVYTKDDLSGLRAFAKALIDLGKSSDAPGFAEFAKSLARLRPSEEIRELASLYAGAKKAMIVFARNLVSVDAARLLGEIALLSGHIGSPRDGILQLLPKNNTQGLTDLGITAGPEALEGVRALLVFGEDPEALPRFDFLMVSDTHATKTARKANVVLPATGAASSEGTFTNTERRLQAVLPAIREADNFALNWEIPAMLAELFEKDFGWTCAGDISREMERELPAYRSKELGEVDGGVLKPAKRQFFASENGAFLDPQPVSDALMRSIRARLPHPKE